MPQLRVISNDLDAIARRLVEAASKAAEDTAQDLANDIKETAPAHIRDDVSVEQDGPLRRIVTVGQRGSASFDAAMQEYGTSQRPANPYVVPAAERQRGRFHERLRGLIRG
jgi:HK97 gp10 family phage protein